MMLTPISPGKAIVRKNPFARGGARRVRGRLSSREWRGNPDSPGCNRGAARPLCANVANFFARQSSTSSLAPTNMICATPAWVESKSPGVEA